MFSQYGVVKIRWVDGKWVKSPKMSVCEGRGKIKVKWWQIFAGSVKWVGSGEYYGYESKDIIFVFACDIYVFYFQIPTVCFPAIQTRLLSLQEATLNHVNVTDVLVYRKRFMETHFSHKDFLQLQNYLHFPDESNNY